MSEEIKNETALKTKLYKILNNINKLERMFEGILNDYEGGISTQDKTISQLIDCVLDGATNAVMNDRKEFRRDLMISIENRRKFYLENNRPDNASTLEILLNDIKSNQLLNFMREGNLSGY